jgi:Domain of unknown function (DUF4845)
LKTFAGSHPGPRFGSARSGLLDRARHERGLSLVSMVVLVVVVGFVAVIALRVVPTFVEYRAITSAVKKSKDAPSVAAIQQQFDRSAAIDNIDAISAKDLDVQKTDDGFVISFAYTKKIPLFGPVSLTIDYSGNSKSL